jgi:hypothetical protein
MDGIFLPAQAVGKLRPLADETVAVLTECARAIIAPKPSGATQPARYRCGQ